jgi:hypothetical protein
MPNIQFGGAKSPATTSPLVARDSHCLSVQFLGTWLIIKTFVCNMAATRYCWLPSST